VSVTIRAFQKDGTAAAGSTPVPLAIGRNGHKAAFVGQLIADLPEGFTGVLDLSSSTPFAALTQRSQTNSRGDFLLTTFPIADANQAAPAPIVFPQIAVGGGYTTQFFLLSAAGAANMTISFFGDTGAPLALGK
jgi:hypothetical protein